MKSSVLTLVSAEKDLALRAALEILKAAGVDSVAEPVRLDGARAADIVFEGNHPGLVTALMQKLSTVLPRTDIFIQPHDAFRQKKLFVADMDATMMQGETIDEMAAHLGLKEKIAPLTARAMRGEIDFPEALRQRVALLKGMTLEDLDVVKSAMRPMPGAETLVRTMARFGARCVLVSGGFDLFTGHAAHRLGFHKDYANRLGIGNGRLTGEVIPPIVDKDLKKKILEDEARKMGIDRPAVLAAGDGANDIPMLKAAGVGVGIYAKPAVAEATPHQLRHTDLTALLFMQGYKRADFSASS